MHDSERLAIAARLHVALRRKTGRVTDTEWMASDATYGMAMSALALAHAKETDDADLQRLALLLRASLNSTQAQADKPAPAPAAPSTPETGQALAKLVQPVRRYVGGLR
ncbi:MAG: hypothetical protein WBC18_02785 [Ottowia sp.]|uniref:hypothetical protein n=1 Tax=Ottowia sp. TaxID=1898956 RepID=UPI003C779D58